MNRNTYVPEAFNPKVPQSSHKIKPLPGHAKAWNGAHLAAWYDGASQALDALGVRAYDFQVIITKTGQPYIIDTDYLVKHATERTPSPDGDSYNSGQVRVRKDLLLGSLGSLP